jgi:hypothetical protein
LTRFSGEFGALSDSEILHLPKGLTDLRLNCYLEDEQIALLPRGLETLTLLGENLLTDECSKFLPRGLKHFYSEFSPFSSRFAISLPENLLGLGLPVADFKDVGIAALPRSLTVLYLGCSSNITDECAAFLPRGLKELDFSYGEKLTNKFLRDLPQGLEHLDLYANQHISDRGIPLLPKSLTYLNVSKNEKLTNACARFLPRNLKTFYADSAKMTLECMPDLPPMLVVGGKLSHLCTLDDQ